MLSSMLPTSNYGGDNDNKQIPIQFCGREELIAQATGSALTTWVSVDEEF
jgi:hypothetical protein